MAKGKILQVCAIDSSVNALLKPLILKSMENGYDVHNACSDTGKFEQLTAEGLAMKKINIDRKISPVSNLKSVIALYRLIRKEKYDIVHVHTPVAALIGRIAAKFAGTKNIIYTAHGFYFHDEMSKKQYDFFFKVEKYAARWLTDCLLLQSKEDYELAKEEKFKNLDNTIHLSNGVDIWNKFHPNLISSDIILKMKKDIGIEKDDIVFSFIGRLVKEKGIFELVEAFKRVAAKNPKAKLVLIGGLSESERDQSSYEILLENLNHPNIFHIGFRKDIPALMAMSDCFILPSHREGLPRSIIEAMAMETPIIASNIRGCREEVFHNENGILFTKGNTDELQKAIYLMISDSELRRSYGEKSRKIAEKLFDENKVIMKQVQLFDKLI